MLPIGGSNIEDHDPATLLKLNPNIAVIIIVDSDVKNEYSKLPATKEDLKEKFENDGITVYFWKKNGRYIRTIENLFTVETINRALNIELDSEIGFYEDVPLKISRALFRRRDYNQNKNSSDNEKLVTVLHEKGNLYNKLRHGKKIAMKIHPIIA
ncbi:MAG: hypothetical protein J7J01_04985 [Methanophagales archaeon]|nr:hypothetical protein [Methanophagales archaeon]